MDEKNHVVGRAEKSAVHAQGLPHRAFSIFLVDDAGRVLLQRLSRAAILREMRTTRAKAR